jgi:hypothetical protein
MVLLDYTKRNNISDASSISSESTLVNPGAACPTRSRSIRALFSVAGRRFRDYTSPSDPVKIADQINRIILLSHIELNKGECAGCIAPESTCAGGRDAEDVLQDLIWTCHGVCVCCGRQTLENFKWVRRPVRRPEPSPEVLVAGLMGALSCVYVNVHPH